MSNIRLKNIKNFICRDINLEITDKEFLVLWGPTGAGKTTLLNIVAGLIEYEGSVLFNDIPVDRVPVYQRKVGYLFQNLILFPHLDVKANIAYGFTIQGKPKKKVQLKIDELLKLMKIEHLAHRYPKDLSGGEKQRVAMVKNHKNNPDVWDEQNKKLSITMEIIHKEHPESWDTDAVKKGRIKQRLTIKENHKNNPDVGERHSAWFQGQDYDGGEWTGYTDKSRPHIVPTHACIQINDWFEGCHGHHITKSIIVFIPAELHNHFKPHNLRSGLNMGEINAVAIQFVNGGLNI